MRKRTISDWKRILSAVICVLLVFCVLTANVAIFRGYEAEITRLQQDNLLTIAKTVASSLESAYESCRSHFEIFFDAADTQEDVAHYFQAQTDGICAVYLVNERGDISHRMGKDYDDLMPDVFQRDDLSAIQAAKWLSPLLIQDNRFIQMLAGRTTIDGVPGYVLAVVEMDAIYRAIVQPIQVGISGYSMVKDDAGMILMHRAKNQIGLDAVQGRLELYQDRNLDLADLERWVNEQKTAEEGARLLHSYWWDDPDTPKSEKLVAFTKISVGDDIWVVNSTLDYLEVKGPIERTRILLNLVTAGIVLLLAGLIYQTVNAMNREKTMRLEINHLQALRKNNELLRHNEKISTIGAMTSMISHEFKNHLTPIQIYGELLLDDESQSEASKEYIREILEAAREAADLTRELSIYGRQDFERKAEITPIQEELEHSLKFIQKTLPDHIVLSTRFDESKPTVRVRHGVMNQIMVNLCTNAIHAMGENGGLLQVEGFSMAGDFQRYYHISVKDSGCGMSEEVLTHLFQPFYTTKKAGVGTGLGLSIIRDIIQQAGGSITAHSKEGLGSRFDIRLPLYQMEEAALDADFPIHNRKVLVLCGKKATGKAIEKALQPNYEVDCFSNPVQALSALTDMPEQWDAVLVDYQMPVLGGIEFAQMLRQQGVGVAVLLMTSHPNKETQAAIEEAIIHDVIERPVTLALFEDKFRQILMDI